METNCDCGLPLVLTMHAVLSIGSFELAPGPGIFAILDFHKMDVPLVGSELPHGHWAKEGCADAESPPSLLYPTLLLYAYLGWAFFITRINLDDEQ